MAIRYFFCIIKYMKEKILYGSIGFLAILMGVLLFRVETIHTKTNLITSQIEEMKEFTDVMKSSIKNNPVASQKLNNQLNTNKVYDITIGNSVVLGNKSAPVTIIKWTDFQCPYCAQSAPLVDQLLEKYPNDVKVVIKNFPLPMHRQAMTAAKYSIAAHKQSKYKEMYKKIFMNFRDLASNENLPLTFATELGLDMEQFKKDFESVTTQELINREMYELRSSGMRLAVPKFLINGKEPQGPRSIQNWSSIIDAEIRKAKS